MLPPFVPPSARAAAEPLPLITEFVLHREERYEGDELGSVAVLEAPPVAEARQERGGPATSTGLEPEAALPLITEFTATATAPPPEAAVQSGQSAGWIDEERNAFDWHSIAGLATPPGGDRRAEDEWESTEWDRPTSSPSDHIAGLLAQVARRIRSGELKVDGVRGMSPEAALAATLAALLRSEDE